jgi:DeoR/GlpR family transcriptional regulator of sugar metabolism
MRKADGPVAKGELRRAMPAVTSAVLYTDLERLREAGEIERVAFGQYVLAGTMVEGVARVPLFAGTKLQARLASNVRAKRGVARYIVWNFFKRDVTCAVDAGSGPYWVYKELTVAPPPHAIEVHTSNLAAALLLPSAGSLELHLVGGAVAVEYAATTGPLEEAVSRKLDLAVLGFSRFANQGFWTLHQPQWRLKRQYCAARRVVFAGTLDKIGVPFDGERDPIHPLHDIDFTVVVDSNAAGLSAEERRRVQKERDTLGHRMVMVDDEGHAVDEFVTKG